MWFSQPTRVTCEGGEEEEIELGDDIGLGDDDEDDDDNEDDDDEFGDSGISTR